MGGREWHQAYAAWGAAPDDVWAVGSTILHWDGSAWSAFPECRTSELHGIWASGPNDAWAVGWGTLRLTQQD